MVMLSSLIGLWPGMMTVTLYWVSLSGLKYRCTCRYNGEYAEYIDTYRYNLIFMQGLRDLVLNVNSSHAGVFAIFRTSAVMLCHYVSK